MKVLHPHAPRFTENEQLMSTAGSTSEFIKMSNEANAQRADKIRENAVNKKNSEDMNNNGIPDDIEKLLEMLSPIAAAKMLMALGIPDSVIQNFVGMAAFEAAKSGEDGGSGQGGQGFSFV